MNRIKELLENKTIFFGYMGETYTVKNGASIFLRDILYSIKYYYRLKDIELKYSEAENLAIEFTKILETENELIGLNHKTWKVNFNTKPHTLNEIRKQN
ncbi:MAG: hypothetical protein JEY94_08710 [Melioribacteraceae bacterium]|nr:hypothetical protein [Melioribacteraceae bacterium]